MKRFTRRKIGQAETDEEYKMSSSNKNANQTAQITDHSNRSSSLPNRDEETRPQADTPEFHENYFEESA